MADEPEVAARIALRQGPALVVLTGPPGCGRSTLLRRIAAAAPGPAHVGGGLAMLAGVPALALSRAVRARLPADDVHLLAEAVRSRVRGGLLVLDDLHHADPATVAALPHLARTCRVLVALRTPHRLDPDAAAALRTAATAWLPVPPLDAEAALALTRRTAANLSDTAAAAVVARAGGNPLAITALARQAAAGRAPAGEDIDQVAYAIATALADLPRPARTALAALGLLGRPAPPALLGTGAADLLAAGLVTAEPGGSLLPVSVYVAETAAGLLDAAARVDLHTRLADLTPPAEAARHLAAAGDPAAAYLRALDAADRATGGERATLLLFACALDTPADPRVRIAAADAALTAGRPLDAAEVLRPLAPTPPAAPTLALEAAVLRGEALLQAGEPGEARDAVRRVPDTAAAPVLAGRDRVMLLTTLALEPMAALDLAGKISIRHPAPLPGIAAALAAVRATHRLSGWESALARAAGTESSAAPAPPAGGDPLITRWSAWLLVEHLAADGRLVESAQAATRAAAAAGEALAYGWQTRFLAAADWALALHGHHLGLPAAPQPSGPDGPAGKRKPRGEPDALGGVDFGALAAAASAAGTSAPGTSAPGTSGPGTSTPDTSGPGTSAPAVPSPAALAAPASAPGALVAVDPLPGSSCTPPAATPPSRSGPAPLWAAAPSPVEPVSPGPSAQRPTGTRPSPAPLWAAPALSPPPAPAGPASAPPPVPPDPAFVPPPAPPSAIPSSPAASEPDKLSPADEPAWDGAEGVLRRAANLTDRALPTEARAYATAASALIEADTGLLATARARLAGAPVHPVTAWVAREAAWLDGQPDRAAQPPADSGTGLLAGLHAITAVWAARDLNAAGAPAIPVNLPDAARRTLTAWSVGSGFLTAADDWQPIALREQIRCLIAAGLTETDRDRAVAALLRAEDLADRAGLTVLAGRARRGLRRQQIHRDNRSPRSGGRLTQRELDVLRLVAAGEPTRRIAGQLGISAETVDTHIRSSMRKLAARTRTEAAALAFAVSPARPEPFDPSEDGR